MNRKANILHENVIFIILNVTFFSIMILFVYLQSSSVHVNEEVTAKQVALLIDASKPGTDINMNLKDFFAKAEKNGISKENSVKVDNDKDLVIVRGSKKSFYEYSYFNNIYVEYDFKGDYFVLKMMQMK
jgi:hypothetical protein